LGWAELAQVAARDLFAGTYPRPDPWCTPALPLLTGLRSGVHRHLLETAAHLWQDELP